MPFPPLIRQRAGLGTPSVLERPREELLSHVWLIFREKELQDWRLDRLLQVGRPADIVQEAVLQRRLLALPAVQRPALSSAPGNRRSHGDIFLPGVAIEQRLESCQESHEKRDAFFLTQGFEPRG